MTTRLFALSTDAHGEPNGKCAGLIDCADDSALIVDIGGRQS